jgi:hypothetical protein
MLTPDFFRKMEAKHQAAKAAEWLPEEEAELHPERSSSPIPGQEKIDANPPRTKTRGHKATDTRVLNQHDRSRVEIDALLRREYRAKGPTLLAKELGMKKTAVMMRARRMGLSADPYLSVLRRVITRRQRKTGKSRG